MRAKNLTEFLKFAEVQPNEEALLRGIFPDLLCGSSKLLDI